MVLDCSQRKVDVVEVVPDRKVLGKQFKKDSQLIAEYLKGLSECDIGELEKSLKEKGYVCVVSLAVFLRLLGNLY